MLEVIVSIAIMAVIGGITWMTMQSSLKLREILIHQDTVSRSARVSLDQLKREIKVAFLTSNTAAVNTYQTVFIGKDGGDEDQLWFNSLSHRRKYVKSRESDQAEITLWVEDGPRGRGNVLMHRESGIVDHEPEKGGAIFPMLDHVKEFNLRYLDNKTNEWADEWDSTGQDTPNRLPRAVEVMIIVEHEDPDSGKDVEETFLTTIILEMSGPLKKSLFSGNGGAQKGLPL